MYVIIVYDAAPKRGIKLLKYLRTQLIWVQNSVFEGEVTESNFEKIKSSIKSIINIKEDTVIYYAFGSRMYSKRGVIGAEKNELDTFI
ncbi:MAG: CRISPR-associated endonuclease Cas2 [Ignavibacteriaceae bacterium]|jgi:CRISPR-associated protein Cas2|nr:CRISPR-associated endonuclease Cas2 [Ignavibacteriaceae bacterium]HPO55985.1 CRISPR-associated endonuclease Cas2 [Ignavibacteriaceae bacterium]